MSPIRKWLLAVIIIVSFLGCEPPTTSVPTPLLILFPSDEAVFSAQTITFQSSPASESPLWYSDKDGYLGVGTRLTVSLSVGYHRIELRSNQEKVYQCIFITVKGNPSQNIYLLQQGPLSINLLPGAYMPRAVSLAMDEDLLVTSQPSHELASERYRPAVRFYRSPKSIPMITQARSLTTDNIAEFFLYDVTSTLPKAEKITFHRIWNNSEVEFWIEGLEEPNPSDFSLFDELAMNIGGTGLTNLFRIFGRPPDINSDGKVKILFSRRINDTNQVIGFFDPQDLFPRKPKGDPEENLFSNEGEFIYCAYPDNSRFAYSIGSISATLFHELTHLLHFQAKTYRKIQAGVLNPVDEELFIKEGLAHLCESLSGFGVSGGNLGFVQTYLEAPEDYSLSSQSRMNNHDSVGKRGAAALFFSFLLEKAGGFTVDASGSFIDKGGLSYLSRLSHSDNFAWEGLGKDFGATTDSLFLEFSDYLETSNFIEDLNPSSLLTGEPLLLHPRMGTYMVSEEIKFSINGPARIEFPPVKSILPRSLAFFNTLNVKYERKIQFTIRGNQSGYLIFNLVEYL